MRKQVLQGNLLATNSINIFEEAAKHGVPAILENPATSRLFLVPQVRRMIRLGIARFTITDLCQHGTRWRKPTGLLTCNIEGSGLQHLAVRCRATDGVCSRTKSPHIQLSGTAPNGVCWTRIAQEYPAKLCSKIASVFKNHRFCFLPLFPPVSSLMWAAMGRLGDQAGRGPSGMPARRRDMR